jgi:hypothetical protein
MPPKTVSINRSDVVGTLQRLKGMTFNFYGPLPVENTDILVRMLNHLPITALQVQSSESFVPRQLVQSVVNLGHWDTVFLCDIVQFWQSTCRSAGPRFPNKNDGNDQRFSDFSITQRLCMFSSISLTSACFARGSLHEVSLLGRLSPISIRWHTLSVRS